MQTGISRSIWTSTTLKIAVPALLSIALFICAIFLVSLPGFRQHLLAERQGLTKAVVQSAESLLQHYQQRVDSGELTLEDSQQRAKERLRQLRYGSDMKDYVWINDLQPRMVMHPYFPELEGEDLAAYTDPDGIHLFLEAIRIVQTQGGGFINYRWQWKDDPARIVPKISYVKEFAPWGWIIGSGIYIEDVLADVAKITRRMLLLSVGILGAIGLLTLFIIVQAVRTEKHRRQAEQERLHLASAVEQAAEGIVITDSAGVVEYVNPAFESAAGCGRTDLIGRAVSSIYGTPHGSDLCDAVRRCGSEGRQWKGRITVQPAAGPPRTMDATVSPFTNERGMPSKCVTVLRDVTQELHMEEQLRHAQKMEAIGTLAGGIAHDFNNILGAIIGFAEMARDETPENSSLRYDLDQILQSGLRARDLVRQILTFSRKQRSERAPMHLQPVVQEALQLLRASLPATITITSDLDPVCGCVMADATQIHQVVMNLCTNAAQAMKENGGELKISLEPCTLHTQETFGQSSLLPGRYIRLTVSDTGGGIDPRTRERIFEPFYTTKAPGKGTGMGLAVVHGIIQAHNGSISVESRPGKGAAFSVLLPEIASDVPEMPAGPARGSERILLVDDEEMLLHAVGMMLRSLGYTVSVAQNPHDALARIERDPAGCDLVITDQSMPNMTGYELARKIQAVRPGVPVIVCSGYSEPVSVAQARAAGIRDFIMKPVRRTDLAVALRRILDGPAGV